MNDIKRFKMMEHESAFCHVQIENDENGGVVQATLISYETPVCGVVYNADGDSFLWCTGNYSRSTIKHIGWFTSEFCGHNMYSFIKSELVWCDRMNRKFDGHIQYASITLNDLEKQSFLKQFELYNNYGSKWTKYKGTPNWYALNYSGRFEPIIL